MIGSNLVSIMADQSKHSSPTHTLFTLHHTGSHSETGISEGSLWGWLYETTFIIFILATLISD